MYGQTCVFTSQDSTTADLFGTGIFVDCRFKRNVVNALADNCIDIGVNEKLKLNDCTVEINSAGGNGIAIDGYMFATIHDSDIIAPNSFAVIRVEQTKTIDQNYDIRDCYIEGGSFGVYINGENRTNTVQFIKDCKLVGTNPVGGAYNGADTGTLYLTNCFYTNAFVPFTGVTESGGVVNANIRKPIV